MIEGIEAFVSDDLGNATNLFYESSNIIDLWLVRFCLAHIYRASGLMLEAEDEIQAGTKRSGEAVFAALDEQPTYRYLAKLQSF